MLLKMSYHKKILDQKEFRPFKAVLRNNTKHHPEHLCKWCMADDGHTSFVARTQLPLVIFSSTDWCDFNPGRLLNSLLIKKEWETIFWICCFLITKFSGARMGEDNFPVDNFHRRHFYMGACFLGGFFLRKVFKKNLQRKTSKLTTWKSVKVDFLFAENGIWQTVQKCAKTFFAFRLIFNLHRIPLSEVISRHLFASVCVLL